MKVVFARIVEGKNLVGSGFHIVDHEFPVFVGFPDAQEGFLKKYRIIIFAINTNHYFRHWIQIFGIDNNARYFERIYLVAGRKCKPVIFDWVFFVQIHNGIPKINGVGGAVHQIFLKSHSNKPAVSFNDGLFELWWRNQYIFAGIFYRHIFVEENLDFFFLEVQCTIEWIRFYYRWRNFVFRPSGGSLRFVGTRMNQKTNADDYDGNKNFFHYNL